MNISSLGNIYYAYFTQNYPLRDKLSNNKIEFSEFRNVKSSEYMNILTNFEGKRKFLRLTPPKNINNSYLKFSRLREVSQNLNKISREIKDSRNLEGTAKKVLEFTNEYNEFAKDIISIPNLPILKKLVYIKESIEENKDFENIGITVDSDNKLRFDENIFDSLTLDDRFDLLKKDYTIFEKIENISQIVMGISENKLRNFAGIYSNDGRYKGEIGSYKFDMAV